MSQARPKNTETAKTHNRHVGVKTFIGTFGTSIFIQACTLLQGIMVARLLGPKGRGELAAIILWPSIFSAIGLFGVNIAVSRTAAKKVNNSALFRTSILLSLCTSLVSIILCFVFLPHLLPESEKHLLLISKIFLIYIPINHLTLNLTAIDQGIGNFKHFNLTRAILNPSYILCLIIIWILGTEKVLWFVSATLFANIFVLSIRLTLTLKKYNIFGSLYPPVLLTKESLRFGISGMAVPLYNCADKALLLWLLGTKDLGLYMIALSASAVISSVTNSTGMVTFTMAAQADKGKEYERILKVFRVSALLWIVLGGLLAIVLRFLLPLIYGHEFSDAVGPARLLIIGSAFAGLSTLLEQTLRGQGYAFVGLKARFIGIIVMAGVGFTTSGLWGINGICIAYITAQLSCLTVLVCSFRYHQENEYGFGSFIPGTEDILLLKEKIFSSLPNFSKNQKLETQSNL